VQGQIICNNAGNLVLHVDLDRLSERLPAATLVTSKQTNSRNFGLLLRSKLELRSSGLLRSNYW
jgi:hypothetical protein